MVIMDKFEMNKIIEKSRMKIAVSNFEEEGIEMQGNKKSILNLVATFIIAIGLTSGLVYATGTAIYEKIWKEPEKYQFSWEVTESDKEKAISENEAREQAEKYLEQIGLNDEVSGLTLRKDTFNDIAVWNVGFTSGSLVIDNKGNFQSLNIPSYNYKIPKNYGITRVEARKTATELFKKYNPNNNSSEYELVSLKRNNEDDKYAYIWYADFYKKYGDLYNRYEKISIGWIPTINGLYSLNIENLKYENNEQKISKEEAIKIATEKDKTIEKRYTIQNAEANIWIDKMNTEVVYREKNLEEYEKGNINFERGENGQTIVKENAEFYKVENRVRKVWEVTLYYDYVKYESNGPECFTYYVDSTTGEIIGGNRHKGQKYYLEALKSDPNNVIEK